MSIFVANWKMNIQPSGVESLVQGITNSARNKLKLRPSGMMDDDKVILCPPSIYVQKVCELTTETPVFTGVQNTFYEESGAYTGEISNQMIAELGATYVIIGHSERRQFFGETDNIVNRKVSSVIKANLLPIICIGETLDQRESGEVFSVIESQILSAVSNNESLLEASNFLLAYEPVWAIGTGKVASPEQAQEVHSFIKSQCQTLFNDKFVPVLYGGSVKPENARLLLDKDSIDGFLVGGASLNARDFNAIINA